MQRIKKFFNQENSIKGASLLLIITLFLSNFLGMIRDHFLAQKIPTSTLDTYYAAFRIPDLIFNIFILGAISAALIPVFTQYRVDKEKEAWKIVNSFLNFAVILVIISIIVLYFLMPNLINYFVADFNVEKKELTTTLARLLLLSPLFFAISYIIGGVLNSYRRFFAYSLAPLIYNLSIISFTLLFADQWGIKGVVYGVILGALLHLLIQLPSACKLGFHYQAIIDWKNQGVKKIISLMIPRSLGLGAMQIMLLIYTSLAASISSGAVAVLNLADNIQTMPTVVFATSFATAIFPTLSEFSAQKKDQEFSQYFWQGVRIILFFLIPISFLVILLRTEIVRVILGSGWFKWQQTIDTANVLGFFAISFFAQGLIPLLSRSFYALKDTKTPTIISIISILISIIFGYFLAKKLAVTGLALAYSLGAIINFLLLYWALKKRFIILAREQTSTIKYLLKIILSALIMAVMIQLAKNIIGNLVDMERFWGVMTKLVLSTFWGILIYLYISHLLGIKEISQVKEVIWQKFRTISNGKKNKDANF